MLPDLDQMQSAERSARLAARRRVWRPGSRSWWITMGVATVGTLWLLLGPWRDNVWESPLALFIIVTIAASLCVLGASGLLVASWRAQRSEAGILVAGLYVVSALPLVHGLTAPGVWYGPNQAVMSSVYVALPLALIVMSPLMCSPSGFSRVVGRHWRLWVGAWLPIVTAMCVAFLVWPDMVTVPGRDHPVTWTVAAVGFFGALWMSRAQLRLYWIGERSATLVASFAFVLLGATSLVWLGDLPFSVGWWAVHALDIVGVFAGVAGVWVSHRLDRGVIDTLAPVVSRDPLAALELGFSPVVHRFVRSLEQKDPVTRDHVVRTAELAVRVGELLDLDERQLRFLGLGALLHDIGKLDVPDEILHKPGALSDEEYAVIKRHPVAGAVTVANVTSLAPAAPFIRGHHERMDGQGYPDQLAGPRVPLEARIIAVCDAFDAMAHTRQYRDGMGADRAIAVLREHAGSQWDGAVVEALVQAVADRPEGGRPQLDAVGRDVFVAETLACDCVDALPDDVATQLEAAWVLFASDMLVESEG